jgi:hypothetical protein
MPSSLESARRILPGTSPGACADRASTMAYPLSPALTTLTELSACWAMKSRYDSARVGRLAAQWRRFSTLTRGRATRRQGSGCPLSGVAVVQRSARGRYLTVKSPPAVLDNRFRAPGPVG